MKVLRDMKKKLKSWSRNKRRNKTKSLSTSSLEPFYWYCHQQIPIHIPPPSLSSFQQHHCTTTAFSTQPSAPPLPPWLEADLIQQQQQDEEEEDEIQQQEEITESSETSPILAKNEGVMILFSDQQQQQYTEDSDPDPDPEIRRSSSPTGAGGFRCVIELGMNLIHLLFPCFHIPQQPPPPPLLLE